MLSKILRLLHYFVHCLINTDGLMGKFVHSIVSVYQLVGSFNHGVDKVYRLVGKFAFAVVKPSYDMDNVDQLMRNIHLLMSNVDH